MIQKIRMDMSIGSNIQKRRYQCKLKQDQVIAKMNLMGIPISKSSYAKIETNRMNIKVSELVALAKILDCEVGDFFKDLEKISSVICCYIFVACSTICTTVFLF